MSRANGHQDVDFPREMHGVSGCALVVLYHELMRQGYQPRYQVKDKDADIKGNHVFDAWIYVLLGDYMKSQVQFGVTVYQDVNPVPHLWVRGKDVWRAKGYGILVDLVKTSLPKFCQSARQPATILADFKGHDWGGKDTWGAEYLPIKRGDKVTVMHVPPHCYREGWCASEGWSLVMKAGGKGGWVPYEFLHFEGPPSRPPPL